MAGPAGRLRVLVVGGDERDRHTCQVYLERDPASEYEFAIAGDARAALAQIASQPIDCVLLNHAPPAIDALDFLRALGSAQGRVRVPVMVLEEQGSDIAAVEVMRAGAQDYASRARITPEGLARGVRNAIEKVKLQSEIERRQLALEESQRQQLELKDQLISHVSHELRTPLTAIHQFVTILIDQVPGPLAALQREYLEIILRNVRALRGMIDDLMEATRCESGKLAIEPRVVALEQIARESVASMRAAADHKRLTLILECERDLPRVVADPARVRQILGNLLDNAIKFTPPGRRIQVGITPCPHTPGRVAVAVQDEGCGIRQDRIPLVFERMHQEPAPELGSRRGLGLGLYICRELVEGQGGEIWAESERGAGSRFVFSLPAFSLQTLLRPALERGVLQNGPLFLIALRAAPQAGADLDEDQLSGIYATLQRLVYQESDIVIPRVESRGAQERFYVIAPADRAGADAMIRRLQRAIDRAEELPRTVAVDVSARPVALPARGADPERWLDGVAARLAAMIESDHEGEPCAAAPERSG